MSDDILETMAAGMTGRFWWLVDGVPKQPHTNGHIRRDEAGYWVVEVEGWRSMENTEGSDDDTYPDSMIAVLRKGTVFLSDRRRLTDFSLWSGQRIHVVRSTFATAVTGLDVNTVEADGIIEAEVLFPNQNPWDRSERPDWRYTDANDPLGMGATLDLPLTDPTKWAIGGGVTLTVRPTWWSDRDMEQIRINPALSLKLSAAEPKPTSDLVEAFEWMQDLIGHCWGGRVLPVPGAGKVNSAQEEPGRFWSQRLFERHHVQLADLSHPFPAVHLPDLGGPRAFVRWVILCRHFSRATRAVSEGLYVGASAETRLLNTMAAIEYWVKRHEGRRDWVKVWGTGPVNPMHALIRHLKPAFRGWVGDGAPFSRRIWGDYNWLKHNPEFEIDYTLVRRFTWAAETMLLADLLNEVAGTAVPANRLVTHRWGLRDEVQGLLQDRARSAPPPKWTNGSTGPVRGAVPESDLDDRIEAVAAFNRHEAKLIIVGDFKWDEGFAELRLLATNYVLRRQQEALEAAVQLARSGLGHLSAGFIRPALDELLWMSYLKAMDHADAQELMRVMGVWDACRSLAAQRSYVGDSVMQTLWYPIEMLDQHGAVLATTKDRLKALGKKHGWSGLLPTAGWLAEKADLVDLTEYLHAATSRSLHFSIGEIERQCWGEPGSKITTKKPEFREHVTNFALHQLPPLLIRTIGATMPFLEAAGITSGEVGEDEWTEIQAELDRLGNVPLVHAHEWNLTPEGPSPLPQPGSQDVPLPFSRG